MASIAGMARSLALKFLFPRQRSFGNRLYGSSWFHAFDAEEQISLYRNFAYACIRYRARRAGSVPLRVYALEGTRVKGYRTKSLSRLEIRRLEGWVQKDLPPNVEEIKDHPFSVLFQRPNPVTTGRQLVQIASMCLDLFGKGVWHYPLDDDGRPGSIQALYPQYLEVVPDPVTVVREYRYGQRPNQTTIPRGELSQFIEPHPDDPLEGLGGAEAGKEGIQLYNTIMRYNSAMYKNGAVPSTLVVTDEDAEPEQEEFEAFQAAFRAKYGGADKAGAVHFTNNVVKDIKPLSLSPKSMEQIALAKHLQDEIAATIGIPKILFEGSNNRAETEAKLSEFLEGEIVPRLNLIQDCVNRDIMPLYDPSGRLMAAFDNPVPNNRELENAIIANRIQNNAWTINEVREIDGKPPLPDGDQLLDQLRAGLKVGPDALSDDAKGKKSFHRPFGPGAGKQLPPALEEDFDEDVTEPARELHDAVVESMDEIRPEVMGKLRRRLEQTKEDDLIDAETVFAAALFAALLLERGSPPVERTLQAAASEGAREIRFSPGDVPRSLMASAAKHNAFKFARKTSETLVHDLQDLFFKAAQCDIPRAGLAKTVEAMLIGDNAEYRAERIVRTEVRRIHTRGKQLAWRASGMVKARIWKARGDACQFCRPLNGKVIGIDRDFWHKIGDVVSGDKGGSLTIGYENIDGPPLHPNCRCYEVAELKEA